MITIKVILILVSKGSDKLINVPVQLIHKNPSEFRHIKKKIISCKKVRPAYYADLFPPIVLYLFKVFKITVALKLMGNSHIYKSLKGKFSKLFKKLTKSVRKSTTFRSLNLS